MYFLPISSHCVAIHVISISYGSLLRLRENTVIATRPSPFQTKSKPFIVLPDPHSDVGADTLVNQSNVETVFADTGWKSTTLKRLSDVEDLLDCLEASGFAEREMETRGNCTFNVRWR